MSRTACLRLGRRIGCCCGPITRVGGGGPGGGGRRIGLVDDARWGRLREKEAEIERVGRYLASRRHGSESLGKFLRRPEVAWSDVEALDPSVGKLGASREAIEQVVLETKYAGYVERQAAEGERFRRLEHKHIPEHFNYRSIAQLRMEA